MKLGLFECFEADNTMFYLLTILEMFYQSKNEILAFLLFSKTKTKAFGLYFF